MTDFAPIVAAAAERLRALEIREVVYFHCDHFEPWDFSRQTPERAAQQVVDFVDAVQKVDFARRLTLFYSNPWNTRLSAEGDLVRAAAGDKLGFVPRREAEHETLGAPFRYLRAHSGHEIQVHIHHEFFTWTRSLRDAAMLAYLDNDAARALDGLRLECAVEQWLRSARREFDYAPARWFFVHGLWSLNGADPDGCTIDDEIARLMKWGCRGDFTFPAGRRHCDPRFEAPYFCAPAVGPKSYDGEAADAEFAWGNAAAAADKFFIWNSPIKAPAASLDWGDPGLRAKLNEPAPFAQEIVERSFRWDGVLFIKTHAHSMHRMNRDDDGGLVYPHCYAPIRDLYGAVFEAAAAAGATVTLASAGEVYDRFVDAARPAVQPPMATFQPHLVGREWRPVGRAVERVRAAAAAVDRLATAALAERIAALGVEPSGAEAHYAALAGRGSVVPAHDLRAAEILLSLFGTRHAVHEIGAGIGGLPLLLAALGMAALGIESSQRRYEACLAVAARVAADWPEPRARCEFLLGRFPECLDDRDLSDTVAVVTDFTCTMSAEERRGLIAALRRYGAVLLEAGHFVRRLAAPEEQRALIDELRGLGLDNLYDADISADFAFVVAVNNPRLLQENGAAATPTAPAALPSLVELGGFEHDAGYCYRAPLPPYFPPGGATVAADALVLFQDGIRLGPPDAAPADIRGTGGGRFRHAAGVLYFSTRDNSDPRLGASRLHAFHPSAGEEPARQEAGRGGAAAPDPGLSIPLSPPFEPEIERCWIARLQAMPEAALFESTADDDAQPDRSPIRLYEDGAQLGPAHAAHAEIRRQGAGAFSHWKDAIYFSTSDGSDPNRNGRRYELRLPR